MEVSSIIRKGLLMDGGLKAVSERESTTIVVGQTKYTIIVSNILLILVKV